MKQLITLAFLLTISIHTYSISDKIRVGFQASPGVSWSKPMGKDLQQGKPRFGVSYGFVLEYWFAKNYGLATGLGGAFDGCNIKSRDIFRTDTTGSIVRNVNEKYGFNYIELPAYLKLKTNDIKRSNFNVWGQLGFTVNITVSARATYSEPVTSISGTDITIVKENILRKGNDVNSLISGFRSNFIDVRLGAGAGFEYKFDKKAALVCGLFYHNGFINNIFAHDAKKEPNVMRFISLRVGVLF